MATEETRRLIWIPIVHTAADMGTLERPVKQLLRRRGGEEAWQDRVRRVGQLWRWIRSELLHLPLDFSRVLLYQDGLPVCGKEERIVEDLARTGSANHRLLLELRARGAKIIGTESPDLLIEEYELNRRLLLDEKAVQETFAEEIRTLGRDLLERRDEFVANRIDETLGGGQVGCLFLGLMHSIEQRLPRDIRVTRLQPTGQIPGRTGPDPSP